MTKQKRPHTARRYFTQSFCLESINRYDRDMLLHGEQRSWWDRRHHYPRELSIYQHGTLIRTIQWYINGNIQKSINTYRDIKEVREYYPSGSIKYQQNYKLGEMGFVRHGEWSGYYRNGKAHYEEVYVNGVLKSRVRYISTGKPLSGYGSGDNIAPNSGNDTVMDKDKVVETQNEQLEIVESPKKYSEFIKQFLGRFFIKF